MFTQQRAVESFTSEAITFAAGPMGLVASAAVCYLVATRLEQPIPDLTIQLRKAVEDAGLKVASIYRYVRIGRDLAAEVAKDQAAEKEVIDKARSPAIAQSTIIDWLAKQDISSVDAISRFVGSYVRKPRQATAEAPESAQPAAMRSEAVAEDETEGDPIAFAKELAHRLRLNHDRETLIAIRNVFDAEIVALERSEKRSRSKPEAHASH